jgi:hypothetical protein
MKCTNLSMQFFNPAEYVTGIRNSSNSVCCCGTNGAVREVARFKLLSCPRKSIGLPVAHD